MDADQIKLIQQAVSEGLESTRWLLVLVGLIAAGAGAFFDSYLRKRGEDRAIKEGFQGFLEQLRRQTEVTEAIKAEVDTQTGTTLERLKKEFAEDLAKGVEDLRDSLERDRTFNTFRREQISDKLDRINASIKEILFVSEIVGMRSFAFSGDLIAGERTIFSELSSVKINTGILLKLEAIPRKLHDSVIAHTWTVWHTWTFVTGQLTLRNPDFRKEFPTEPPFSAERFNQQWDALRAGVKELEDAILEITPNVQFPK
jgi:hypothetical protein